MFNRSTVAASKLGQRSNVRPSQAESIAAAHGWLGGRKQAAAYCGVSTRTINRWMAQGMVKYQKLSYKLLIFRPADLDAAIVRIAEMYEKTS